MTLLIQIALIDVRRVGRLRDEASGRSVDGKDAVRSAHDDLVIALAIAATIASRLPRQLRQAPIREYIPEFTATGF